MPDVRFDRYYRYEDLSRIAQAYAAEYPQLVRLQSIGQSHEGREVWLITVTCFATGEDTDKPALWVDGNIHASEVSPSSACLYLIEHLVTAYGHDPDVTRCLDTRAFYICPRVNPDGAEWALADKPKIIRFISFMLPVSFRFPFLPSEGVVGLRYHGHVLRISFAIANGSRNCDLRRTSVNSVYS